MSDEFRFDENDNGGHIKNTNVVFMPQMQVVDEYINRIDPVARGYTQVESLPKGKNLLDENTAAEVAKVLTSIQAERRAMPSAIVSDNFIGCSPMTARISQELPMPPYNYQKEDYSGSSITGTGASSVYMNPLGSIATPIKMPQVDLSNAVIANTGLLSWYETTPKLKVLDLNQKTTLTIDSTNYDVVFTGNKYKYNELNLLNEMVKYVDKTYSEHYSSGRAKTQALDSIIDSGHGFSFCIGNVLKYAQRVEKKGTREDGRKDLQKIIHYAILALNEYDQETLQINEAK